MDPTKVFDYTCHVFGIWGRNRKPKPITFKLKKGVDRTTPLADADVIKMAKEAMQAHKVKPGSFYKVEEFPIELEKLGEYTMEKFVIFSERLIEKGTYQP